MTLLVRSAAATAAGLALMAAFSAQEAPKRWYKGNLHTHTLNSDGDSLPKTVAEWYKGHGYQFLVLSDHNYLTPVEPLNQDLAVADKFLLVPGEEVTDRFGSQPVHVNGYGLGQLVEPTGGESLIATVQGNVDAIRGARGLPSVNHPNFGWAMTSQDLAAIGNLRMLEVYNGHPMVHNRGGGGAESLEEMWDALLTGGKKIYGIAVDDAHTFKRIAKEESNPGKGWVVVRAPELSAASVLNALENGEFYSSTGVELEDVRSADGELRVAVKPAGNIKYTISFIGAGGKMLATSFERVAAYKLQDGEPYVRAVVRASNGDDAWTQPLWR